MDTSQSGTSVKDGTVKKSPLDDLNKDELLIKCKGLLVIAQKAKQAKSELQNEVESYKLQLENCLSEKKQTQESFQTLQELVDSLTEQKLNIITEVDRAKGQIKSLENQNKAYNDEINKFKAELIVKDQKIKDLSHKLSEIDCEVISLKRQNDRLSDENEQLLNQLTEIEARTAEVNNIGLQQREQLKLLEQHVAKEDKLQAQIQVLNQSIDELENRLKISDDKNNQIDDFQNKIHEMTQLYETEKSKKEKVNVKLRSYKDKILKCAACINQLKNSRYILTKTVKEYSENIPKWQNDIIQASKVLEQQINELNNQNIELKERVDILEKQLKQTMPQMNEVENQEIIELKKVNESLEGQITLLHQQYIESSTKNFEIQQEFADLKSKYTNVVENELPSHINVRKSLEEQVVELQQKYSDSSDMNMEIQLELADLKSKYTNVVENELPSHLNVRKSLEEQVVELQQKYSDSSNMNLEIQQELADLKSKYTNVVENELPSHLNVRKSLEEQVVELQQKYSDSSNMNLEIQQELADLKSKYTNVVENELPSHLNVRKSLEEQVVELQQKYSDSSNMNLEIQQELADLQSRYSNVVDNELPSHLKDNMLLKETIKENIDTIHVLNQKNKEITKKVQHLSAENKKLNDLLQNQSLSDIENLNLQIMSLESEKATLVKEKSNARDNVVEVETNNKILTEQLNKLTLDLQAIKAQLESTVQENILLINNKKTEKDREINKLKSKLAAQEEQFNLLKKEYDDNQDMNQILKEEVQTLKLSLEQPRDDADSSSDLNVSLQADIVKLETKLAAYKQENESVLTEIKESRNKAKECDAILADYNDVKSKLASYKTENTELLNEMKEINQVLKERGESISKQQKAIAEMERLIETLEKDRESTNEEKKELVQKIESLKGKVKDAEKKTSESSVYIEKVLTERDSAKKQLEETNNIIAALKDEVEKLKQAPPSAELPNEDMSTSTISRAEDLSRMRELDETFEEKYTKLRVFALKLKKKLNETTSLLQNTEQDKAKLEKMLSESGSTELNKEGQTNSDGEAKASDAEVAELQEKVKSLNVITEDYKNIKQELENVKAQLNLKDQELSSEIEAHKVTKDTLEKARRDVKKKSVLSLEMEDYERSMKELTAKMEEKKKKMIQMESTIDTQEGIITTMKTQIKLLEEQIKTEEKQNRLTKEELHHAIEEGKDKDNVIQTKNTLIFKLEEELEDEKRKNEEADLEMTTLIGEKEKIVMNLGEDKAELNNKVKRLEFKCSELNERLKIVNTELADLKTEYTSYKVRAQAVLRQNQTVDHSQEEQLKEEAAALRAHIDTLTSKLTTAQDQCAEQTGEAESARRRASESAGEAARAQQRTARLHSDLTRLAQQLETERTQHKLQISTLTQCYKSQISDLELKLQKESESLKKQVALVQEAADAARVIDEANQNQYLIPVIPKDDSDSEMDINVSMIPREEGEGSESASTPPPLKTYLASSGTRSPVPLERLLTEGVPEDEALDASSLGLTPDQEIADLKLRLQAQQQRVKHVTVLLSESERECARMAQLAELLKAELRRVRGTSHNAHNAEYMKNVTLKFLTLAPGDERSRLVPVLQKILTLSQDETQKIQAIAKGLDPNPSKGWGSYIPWPGGSK